MDNSYPKHEKLKSRKTIQSLFTQGNSIAQYPIRLVYTTLQEAENHTVGMSVSKKYFKKAVDRNYYKRVLRESYRLNKDELSKLNKKLAIMILYQTKETHDYQSINQKIKSLFIKLIEKEL